MPQNPANSSWLLSSRCLRATRHQPVCVNQKTTVLPLKNWMCFTLDLNAVCAERRGQTKSQTSVTLPLERLEPQTPQLCQLISGWQKLWVQAHSRQSRLEEHQQRLREVISINMLLRYSIIASSTVQTGFINYSLICPTGSILAFPTLITTYLFCFVLFPCSH